MSQTAEHAFDCVARDASGRRQKLRVHARSKADAALQLKARDLAPISLTESAAAAKATRFRRRRGAAAPLTGARLAQFIGRLATLVGRRAPVERALLVLSRDSNASIAASAEAARHSLREGVPIADALTRGGVSDAATLALVRAGDASGDVAGALSEAERLLTARAKSVSALTAALVYPALLFVVSLVSVGLIMLVILPEFRPMVESRGATTPPLAQAVFAVSGWLEQAAPPIGVMMGAAALLAARDARRKGLAAALAPLASVFPIVRASLREARHALILRILGALVSRGARIDQTLRTAAEAVAGAPEQARLEAARKKIVTGARVAETLESEDLSPSFTAEMIRIGEESGELGAMLTRAADDLDEASAARLRKVLTLAEPALISFVGLVIGVCLYALFSAIVSVNEIPL